VELVRIANGRAQRRSIARSGRSPLFDQRSQCRFADDREHDVPDDAVGVSECRVGDLEEETLLTTDAFEILKQLVFDAAFGSRVDAVDRFDQQVDQVVGDRTATDDGERCKPGQPRTFGVPAQFVRFLDGNPLTVRFELGQREAVEESAGVRVRAEPVALPSRGADCSRPDALRRCVTD